jgi:hypothetical protein
MTPNLKSHRVTEQLCATTLLPALRYLLPREVFVLEAKVLRFDGQNATDSTHP